jgi:hypothetical protein
MSSMQEPDLETVARSRRVHELCRELAELFTVSLEQRRAMDRLLTKLQHVTRLARPQGQLTEPTATSPPALSRPPG